MRGVVGLRVQDLDLLGRSREEVHFDFGVEEHLVGEWMMKIRILSKDCCVGCGGGWLLFRVVR